jgi:Fungal specific transcription factor domain
LKIPPNTNPLVLSYKITAIELLNEKLCSSKGLEEQVSNEAICAVAILASIEWYWSEFEVVEKHLKGLAEMVRLRGGLGELGLHEFLKRMILMYTIASSAPLRFDLLIDPEVSTII